MNAVAGVLLLECNEFDAASLLLRLRLRHSPLYFAPTLDGVHVACSLVTECLHMVDAELAVFLEGKCLSARIFALPWVLSLGSALAPTSEATKLFDFLFLHGVHWMVPCNAALVVSLRTQLLASQRPWEVFKKLPPLNAGQVTQGAQHVWEQLGADERSSCLKH